MAAGALLAGLWLAGAAAPAPAPLTLGECVRRALERGFQMELSGHDLAVAEQGVPAARSLFDPVLFASAGKSTSRRAAQGLQGETRTGSEDVSIGISQFLPTGAALAVNSSLIRTQTDPAATLLNPAYNSDLTLSLTQPLLQGAGLTLNRTGIRGAEISLENARRGHEAQALDLINRTENAYYQLAGAREQLQVVRASLTLAQRQLSEAKARHAAGMVTRLDVLQAEVGVANARGAVLQAQDTVRSSEDALLALIGRFEFDTPPGPVQLDASQSRPLPQAQDAYERALARQPALLNARAALELGELDLKVARNQLLPGLDLSVALGVNASEGRGADAFERALERENSVWQAGLTLTYPWGRRGEKARYRQSEVLLQRQYLALEQQEQDLLVLVREAVRRIETSAQNVVIAEQAARLSEEQYEAEQERYSSGLSTSRRVLEAQTDLERARTAHLQARLDHQVSRAALRRIEAGGLEYYGVELAQPR